MKKLLEAGAGACKVAFHGAFGDTEPGRHVRRTEIFPIGEYDGRTLANAEPVDGCQHIEIGLLE
jgi:hypothetical protein